MMRPKWLAALLCRLRGHSCVLLDERDYDVEVGDQRDVPIVCDRCWTLGTMTLVRVA